MTPLERRLKLLKAEIDLDFPGLLSSLENGRRIVLVTDDEFGKDLNPEALRRIGGMAMLCNHYYGATVIIVNENRIVELNRNTSPAAGSAS